MEQNHNEEFTPGQIDTESNLFDLENNPDDYSIDGQFEELAYDQETISNPTQQTPQDQNEGITDIGDFLLNDKESFNSQTANEDENDELDFLNDDATNEQSNDDDDISEEALMAAIAKKTGKTAEEVKKMLEKEAVADELQQEKAQLTALQNKSSLFDRYIQMDNEELVREQLKSMAHQEGKDINDQDIIEEIEAKLTGLKDIQTLDMTANSLRSQLVAAKKEADVEINGITKKQQDRDIAERKQNTQDLVTAMSEIYNLPDNKFMGIKLTPKIVKETFQFIKSGQFASVVNKDQGAIAKLAFMYKLHPEISKKAERPTQSDKNRTAFETLRSQKQDNSARRITTGKTTANVSDNIDLLTKFIQ